jgi:hypothetical protein
MPRSAGPHRLRISGGDFQQKHSQNLVIGGSSEPLASCARPYVSRLVKKAGQSVPLSFSSPSASRSMTVEASLEAHWSLQLAREVEVGRPARPISKLKPRCMSFQTAYSQSCCGRPQLCADNPRSGLAAHSKILASPLSVISSFFACVSAPKPDRITTVKKANTRSLVSSVSVSTARICPSGDTV